MKSCRSRKQFFIRVVLILGSALPFSAQVDTLSFIPHVVPTRADLLHVVWAWADVYVAVGTGGTILRSEDRGSSWVLVPSETTQKLVRVDMNKSGFGIIVADSGIVLKCADRGKTWTKCNLPSTEYYFDVAVSPAGNCLIAGWNAIYRSNDRGQTWTALPMSQFTGKIECLDEANYLALSAGGAKHRSIDSGKTWSPENGYAGCSSIAFLDSKNGYLVGGDGLFKRSTDGGVTWKSIDVDHRFHFYDIAVISPTIAVAVGSGNVIQTTLDGLESFKIPFGSITVLSFRAIAFADSMDGVIVGERGLIYRTVDRCTTLSASFQPPTKNDLTDVVFGNANNGVCVGPTTILFTRDGGTTWNWPESIDGRRWVDTTMRGFLRRAVAFADDTTVVTSWENASVLRSTNGGRTWTSYPATASLVAIDFYDGLHGVGLSDTHCAITSDGGKTWDRTNPILSNNHVRRVCYPARDNITYLTNADQVFCSEDSTTSWKERKVGVPSGYDMYDITFPSRSLGIVLSGWGLSVTTDGGFTWRREVGRGLFKFSRACFHDATYGVSISSSGSDRFAFTEDLGHTWKPVPVDAAPTLKAVTISPSNTVFAVGDQGTILRWKPSNPTSLPDLSQHNPPSKAWECSQYIHIKSARTSTREDVLLVVVEPAQPGNVDLAVYSSGGSLAMMFSAGYCSVGTSEIRIDAALLPSGVYHIIPMLDGRSGPSVPVSIMR